MVESNRIWRGLEQELDADIEWIQGGNLALAGDPERLGLFEQWLSVAREFGLDTRILRSTDVAALIPQMRTRWEGGLYTPSDGHAEPVKATEAFRRAAARLGAEFVTGCAVQAVEVANGAVSGVATERGHIKTSGIVCAAGAWSAKLVRPLGLSLPQRLVRATVTRTPAAAPVTPAGVWAPTVAFRQRRDGTFNLAAGGVTDYDITLDSLRHLRLFLPNYLHNRSLFHFHVGRPLIREVLALVPWSGARRHPFSFDRHTEPTPNPDKVRSSIDAFVALLPELRGLAVDHSWAGYIDVTPDVLPVIGEVPHPRGLLLGTGFSGHGFAMGPIVGRLLSELLLDGKPSLDLHGFRFSRFAERDLGAPHNVL